MATSDKAGLFKSCDFNVTDVSFPRKDGFPFLRQ